jgi:SAM-dependent methyltransferase
MVEETNAALLVHGMKNALALQMDAEDMQFPDSSFEHVLCGFALPFFPNLTNALAEFRRVLKPAGCLAVSTWGAGDDRWNWYDEQRLAYGASLKLTSQPLDRVEELADRLWRAGFAEVLAWTETYDWVCADEEQWWSAIWSISGRAALEKLSPSALERFKAEAFQKMQPLREPDGFHHMLQANFATGIKPY